jgi:hypothetical protein
MDEPTDVTEKDAQAVLEAICAQHGIAPDVDYAPTLIPDDQTGTVTVIAWEGPHEWAYNLPAREALPAHVWLEPINDYQVRVLPRT